MPQGRILAVSWEEVPATMAEPGGDESGAGAHQSDNGAAPSVAGSGGADRGRSEPSAARLGTPCIRSAE